MDDLTGKLLVALPVLADPNFDRTVVLLLQHSAGGALGVVLNRPSTTDVAGPLPRWDVVAADPRVVFVGGPVQPEVAIAIAPGGPHGVETIDLDDDPTSLPIDRVRVFAGYAGWSPGQVEDEIAQGAWVVVDSHLDDAFTAATGDLWHDVLRRQHGRLAWLANLPDDLSVN